MKLIFAQCATKDTFVDIIETTSEDNVMIRESLEDNKIQVIKNDIPVLVIDITKWKEVFFINYSSKRPIAAEGVFKDNLVQVVKYLL